MFWVARVLIVVVTVAQQLEEATIGSLRASKYFDMHGAPISMFDSLR
jgi:hypothetical protein